MVILRLGKTNKSRRSIPIDTITFDNGPFCKLGVGISVDSSDILRRS